MSTTHETVTVTVRSKGAIIEATVSSSDFDIDRTVKGDRRARQIGRRHWLRKETSGWNSGGSHWWETTMKLPNKPERNLTRPIRG